MKRIYFIGYSYNKGGVETYIRNIAQYLKDEYDIVLSLPRMIIDGKEWIVPKNRHKYIQYRKFWRRFFRENHFDVVYFNTCDIVSIDKLVFAKEAGVPVRIIHSHSTGNQAVQGGILGLFHKLSESQSRKKLHKYATNLLACSKTAGDWMFDGRDYTVIKNGIDISRYVYSAERERKASKKLSKQTHPVVACIGRLDHEKNPFFSLGIFNKVCELNSDVQCLFIGDGEHRKELETKIREFGLQERAILVGAVDNVNEWLSYVDVLLMPSLFEGLPFALVEAQAAGIHCLVSDTVSQEANITGLVEYKSLNDSAEEWAKRLLELAEMPRLDVADKLTEAGYSIQHTAKVIKDIINEGLKKCE